MQSHTLGQATQPGLGKREGAGRRAKCEHVGCTKSPSFGAPAGRTRRYCAAHKRPGDILLKAQAKCQHEGCVTRPSFGDRETGKTRYCKAHKSASDVCLVKMASCRHDGCSTQPTFGDPADGKRLYCAAHRREGDAYLGTQVACKHEGCFKQPTYGDPADGRRLYCAAHRREGDVAVRRARRVPARASPGRKRKNPTGGAEPPAKRACAERATPGPSPDEGPVPLTPLPWE